MRKLCFLQLLAFIVLVFPVALAQNKAIDTIFNSEVSELIRLSKQKQQNVVEQTTSIADLKETTLRQTAGIVSVITKEEIQALGYRDLIDVLRLVPGIEFNSDVYNTVSTSMRGNWASEGKILFQVDGIPITEILYGTTIQGNRIPLNQVQRIEIIRGAGSAIYGGNAELGVINIITQNKQKPNLFSASTSISRMGGYVGRRNLDFIVQRQVGNLDFSLGGFLGTALLSDRGYVETNGNFYNSMADYSHNHQFMLNGSLRYKNLQVKFFNENYYSYYTKDTASLSNPNSKNGFAPFVYPVEFPHFHIESSYQVNISPKLQFTPKIAYKRMQAWNITADNSRLTADYTEQIGERFLLNLIGNYKFSEKIGGIVGIETFIDRGTTPPDAPFFSKFVDATGNRVLEVANLTASPFAQLTANTKFGNITIGGRHTYNSIFGHKFVPRIAYTKAFDKLHYKILYSQAFRAPNLLNIAYNYAIKPETTNVAEAEVGYKFSNTLMLTANLFNMEIFNTIVYLNDGANGGFGSYQNAGNTNTAGVEIEAKFNKKWGFINGGYSYYQSLANTVEVYEINYQGSKIDKQHIGSPTHKLTLLANFKINKHIAINPSCIILSERYGQEIVPFVGTLAIQKQPAVAMCNLNLHFSSVLRNISASFGIYNLFDAPYNFVQGYQNGRGSLPAPSREFMLKLFYDVQL
jgi:outer membrane cobalamin receptor